MTTRVPLGKPYTATSGKDAIEFSMLLQFTRDEVRDALADHWYVHVVTLQGGVDRPSKFGARKVRRMLVDAMAAGTAPGDEVSNADEDEEEKAYDWAESVLAHVWPS